MAGPAGQPAPLDPLRALLPLADFFVPNEDEAVALTGERLPRGQAEVFRANGARTVVIKRGAQGVHVRSDDDAFDMPAPAVAVIEPSGAGDAFAAGLIVGILKRRNLEPLRWASRASSAPPRAPRSAPGASISRAEADEYVVAHSLPAARRSP